MGLRHGLEIVTELWRRASDTDEDRGASSDDE